MHRGVGTPGKIHKKYVFVCSECNVFVYVFVMCLCVCYVCLSVCYVLIMCLLYLSVMCRVIGIGSVEPTHWPHAFFKARSVPTNL